MFDKNLEHKTALVTGASAGIGKAVCKTLADRKVDLGLVARREKKLKNLSEELETEYSIDTIVLPTDVRKPDQVKRSVEEFREYFGRLDIMVNNAGVIRYDDIDEFSTEDYRAIMETNCDGMFFFTRETMPLLKRSEGNLVFIGSFDANNPRSFNPIYAASKWWTKGFAHSMECVLGPFKVGVTLINPSEVRTDIKSKDGEMYKEKYDDEEILNSEEIAQAVLFAVSQEKSTTVSQLDIYRRDKMSDFF